MIQIFYALFKYECVRVVSELDWTDRSSREVFLILVWLNKYDLYRYIDPDSTFYWQFVTLRVPSGLNDINVPIGEVGGTIKIQTVRISQSWNITHD